jgi:GAF domain-containing protein/two-component sensor histidine kinase
MASKALGEPSPPPLHRLRFDLRDLYKPIELRNIGDMHQVALLDSALQEIYAHPSAKNLCSIIQNDGKPGPNCQNCPMNRRPTTSLDPRPTWILCSNGVIRPIAPITTNRQHIGWIAGRPLIDRRLLPMLAGIQNENLWPQAEKPKKPATKEDIEASMWQVTEKLLDDCERRRREAIVEDARKRIPRANDEKTVYQLLFEAIRTFYGPLKVVHLYDEYKDRSGEFYRLLYADGLEQRKEHSLLEKKGTHLGLAIQKGEVIYEPNLKKDDPHFVVPSGTRPPKSVLTIPLRSGVQLVPAALQLQSDQQDYFHMEADRKAIAHLADLAALVTTQAAMTKEIASANRRADSTDSWNQFIAGKLLDNSWTRNDILKKFQEVYDCFVKHLRPVAGSECIGASVRLVNRLTNVLGFAAADGPGFQKERMQTLYSPRVQDAAHKALDEGFLYYENVDEHHEYYRLIPETKSLWIKRFDVHGEPTGVVAIDWKVTDGCSAEMDRSLRALIVQFERILEVLADRQDVLVAGFHAPMADREDLNEAATLLVSDLKNLFNSRACTFFLDRYDQKTLTLFATTDPGEGPREYDFGSGITGWVAAHRKTVRIRNVEDQDELDTVQKVHGVSQSLRYDWRLHREGIEREAVSGLSFLAAPLVARGRVLGVIRLTVKNDSSQEFTQQDETFLQNIADRLARSLDARWLAEDADQKLSTMEQDAEFHKQLRHASRLSDVCQMLADHFKHRTQAQGAALLVADREESLTMLTASGVLKYLLTLPELPELPAADAGSACIWDDPKWSTLCAALRTLLPEKAGELIQAGRSIAIPIQNAEAVLVLVWQSPKHEQAPTERQLTDLKEGVETALRLARIQKRQEDANEELQRLQELATACASARGLGEVCAQILEVALREVGMNKGTIRLRRGALEWVLAASVATTDKQTPPVIETNYGLQRCLESREPFVIEATDSEWQAYLATLEPARCDYLSQFRYLMVVPLWRGPDCLGAIVLESQSEKVVPMHGREFLKTLGRYAAVAIHSVQVHENEMEIQNTEMLGAMVQGFVHVLRNKVNNALSGVALLETGKLPTQANAAQFAKVKKDLFRISDVCQDLIRLREAEPGNAQVNLNQFFTELWNDMPEHLKTGVTHVRMMGDRPPLVLGNPAQIKQALHMLMQNALEAMAGRGGRLIYSTKQRNGWTIVAIADTGVGMDETTKARCKDPFFTTKTTGSGLGLSVVMAIARQHHAKLTVVTKQGKGTIWKLCFPKVEK